MHYCRQNNVGVSSLDILKEIAPEDENPAVALDARKGCVYLYIDGKISGAVQLEEAKDLIKQKDYFIITDDKMFSVFGGISYQQKEYPLGDMLAGLVYKKLQSDKCDWKDVKPLYIQPPPGI